MINLSFITPHSPISIPNIGKKNLPILKKTIDSFNKIKNKIIKNKIDTIIIISPHERNNPDIIINNHFQFDINFEKFGDYLSKINLNGDLSLSYRIKESAEPDFWPILQAKSKPDHGATIPLYLILSELNQKIKNFKAKIIIINTSAEKDLKYHFEFGQKISSFLMNNNNKIALISSAELSHCLTRNAPGGFLQKAISFDEKIIENIKKGPEGVENLLNIDPELSKEVKECGLRPISLMLGIINSLQYQPKTLSYQKELGIGYLTMDMELQ